METCDVGSRLAVVSPETPCVATLNNTRAYFSIAHTRCCWRRWKCAIVSAPIYSRPPEDIDKKRLINLNYRDKRILDGTRGKGGFRNETFEIASAEFYGKVTRDRVCDCTIEIFKFLDF